MKTSKFKMILYVIVNIYLLFKYFVDILQVYILTLLPSYISFLK